MSAVDFRDDPLLAGMLTYWQRKRGARAMPRRRDIDPLEMPTRLLPYLQLIEIGEAGRLRFRLVGTAIVDAAGMDATGRYLDETLRGEHRAFCDRLYRTAMLARRPVYGSCWVRGRLGELVTRRIAAPLSENDSDATMILAVTTFGARHRGQGDRAPLAATDVEDGTIEVL